MKNISIACTAAQPEKK